MQAREKVLSLQAMNAVVANNDTTRSTLSIFCKKESTVSISKCVV